MSIGALRCLFVCLPKDLVVYLIKLKNINMKKSDKNTYGTSFHNTTITCTQHQLETILGAPQHGVSGDEKCQMEWVCETKDGAVVTIYDWKEYRKLDRNEMIEWHIGGFKWLDTYTAKKELVEMMIETFGIAKL